MFSQCLLASIGGAKPKIIKVLFSLSLCLFYSLGPRVRFSSFIGCYYRILTHIHSQCGYFCSSLIHFYSHQKVNETRLYALCKAEFKICYLNFAVKVSRLIIIVLDLWREGDVWRITCGVSDPTVMDSGEKKSKPKESLKKSLLKHIRRDSMQQKPNSEYFICNCV